MEERFYLATERIEQIMTDVSLPRDKQSFFASEAKFIKMVIDVYKLVADDELCKLSIEKLRAINHGLYEYKVDISYGNCTSESDRYLCALDAELKAMIPYAYEGDLTNILIRMELFLEIYSEYVAAKEENLDEPSAESLKNTFFYYVSDYSVDDTEKKIEDMLSVDNCFAAKLIMNSDWKDIKNLYLYGEYVTPVEEETLKYISSLPYATLKKMADTYTEGYRIGFEVTNKDLSKKGIVGIRYNLGFEPMIKLAIENFEKLGLKPSITRARFNLLRGRGIYKSGYQGACYSRQYDYEHKDDSALFFDARLSTIKLEALKKAFENHKEEALLFAGPAVVEVFGEKSPEYVTPLNMPVFSKEQQEIKVRLTSESAIIQNEYIKEEERSFTIIAFPTPEVGKDFEKIFDEVIKLNTLDYKLYQKVQQTIIDSLDLGEYAIIKGGNGNKTNLQIGLHKLDDASAQTKFENCVADVNIPVGEVFTSPILKGTDGILNVKKVYLNGLEYKDIMLTIKDGMITDYSCSNFEKEEDNKKYIFDNILFNHETLPMGEFAIGTNTTAYTMARKYDIEDILPILIAEKTGPHFAFGDTCYSHCEEVKVYNPDGKEIVAKENECSLLRDTKPLEAYFNCHTDITIPYDELSEISVVTKDNEVITIIEDGRFVLKGTEILNESLDI